MRREEGVAANRVIALATIKGDEEDRNTTRVKGVVIDGIIARPSHEGYSSKTVIIVPRPQHVRRQQVVVRKGVIVMKRRDK